MKKTLLASLFTLALLLLLFSSPASASPTAKPFSSGDALFWIIATVVLSLVFARVALIRMLFVNPAYILVLIIIIVVAYIFISALDNALGVSEAIDNQIQSLSLTLSEALT